MHSNKEKPLVGTVASGLALLGLATFWLLPIGPIASAAGLRLTMGSAGWQRKLSLTGAYLAIAWATLICLAFLNGKFNKRSNRGLTSVSFPVFDGIVMICLFW